jgi:hypothetical protein
MNMAYVILIEEADPDGAGCGLQIAVGHNDVFADMCRVIITGYLKMMIVPANYHRVVSRSDVASSETFAALT